MIRQSVPRSTTTGAPAAGRMGQAARLVAMTGAVTVLVVLISALSAIGVAADTTAVQDSELWSEEFCLASEECAVGDFNGDGRADVAAFYRQTYTDGRVGDVWVAISNGMGFYTATRWHDFFCLAGETCKVGDFNGDGYDDIVSFTKGTSNRVLVALSNGFNEFVSSASAWNNYFCPGLEVCDVGDFNGDGLDDIVTFLRNSYGTYRAGWVFVALSNGVNQFVPNPNADTPWHKTFCYAQEQCGTGNFDGNLNSRDDIIVFAKPTAGAVWVGLSTGSSFAAGQKWQNFFCPGAEVCRVGDVNGDRKDDIVTFLRSSYAYLADPNARKIGYVFVALSNGVNQFISNPNAQTPWNYYFCIGQEICNLGDFDGGGLADAITFLRSTQPPPKFGDVYVARSTGYNFGGTPPNRPYRGYFPYLRRAAP